MLAATGHEPRTNACTRLCRFLPTLPNGVTIFNNLTLPQQIIVTRIMEETPESTDRLEHFLGAPREFRKIAITGSEHNMVSSAFVFNELGLGYIADFFGMQAAMGFPKRPGRLQAGARDRATRHPAEEH